MVLLYATKDSQNLIKPDSCVVRLELAEYGKMSVLLFLYSTSSIQATLERRLSDNIKAAFLNELRRARVD